MRKTMVAISVVLLLVAGLPAACGGLLVGSGNLKTEQHSVEDFTGVDISSAFEFEIKQSDSYGVNITADDNILDKVEVTKDGNTLKIGLKNFVSLGPVTLKAVVTMPKLTSLVVSGASRGTISDFISAEKFTLDISGASKVSGDITAGDADFDISGASTVQLDGAAANMVVDVSGASRFNLGGFKVNNAKLTVSGACTGTVNPAGRLDADVSGASRLSYLGTPVMGNINISGASTISKK